MLGLALPQACSESRSDHAETRLSSEFRALLEGRDALNQRLESLEERGAAPLSTVEGFGADEEDGSGGSGLRTILMGGAAAARCRHRIESDALSERAEFDLYFKIPKNLGSSFSTPHQRQTEGLEDERGQACTGADAEEARAEEGA